VLRPAVLALLLSACARAPASAATLHRGVLTSGGLDRTYAWLAPPGDAPRPLVIALHGRGGDGLGQERLSGLAQVAVREGFALTLPDGFERSWHDGRDVGPAAEAHVDDVAFLGALIDRFVAEAHVDPRRVYLVGMSNGGFVALTAACALADRVAAVASVTGAVDERLAGRCAPSRPVPVALFAGDADPLVPYGGGEVRGGRGAVLSADASAALWARLDRCRAPPDVRDLPDVDPADGTTVTLRRWSGCADGTEVRLYAVHGGGHTWPGGAGVLPAALLGVTSRDLSATEEAWAFLRAHALPAVR
jgi:polyhydroxybutyrate depolymerase